MDIRLTRELEAFIRKRVKSGMYKDGADVVREALRTLVDQERLRASHVADMKQKIGAGLRQARRAVHRHRHLLGVAPTQPEGAHRTCELPLPPQGR